MPNDDRNNSKPPSQRGGSVTRLDTHKRKSRKTRAKGDTLCRRGFHKWQPINSNPFDVRKGKLITGYRCSRCGKTRAKTD